MHSCCSNPYDLEFDQKHALNDLEYYKLKGPKKNSKPLIRLLGDLDLSGLKLLDIGGGVGTVIFELFNQGIQSAIHIDISSAYVNSFLEEAVSQSLINKIQSYQGDFIDLHQTIDPVDVVTLDKVICCYPDYEDLVRFSAQKATKWYAIVIPRDRWWVKGIHYLESKWNRLKGKHFKTFIHPVFQIENIIEKEGLCLYKKFHKREWLYCVYRR